VNSYGPSIFTTNTEVKNAKLGTLLGTPFFLLLFQGIISTKIETKTEPNTSPSLPGTIIDKSLFICQAIADLEKMAAQEWA
jgi:hypothetical protein